MAAITERTPARRVTPVALMAFSNQNAVGGGDRHEADAKLRGHAKWREFRKLLYNCSIIAACLNKRDAAIKRAKWGFVPNQKFPAQSQAIAEELDEIFENLDTPWPDIVLSMSTYELLGFRLLEWVLKPGSTSQFVLEDVYALPNSVVEWLIDERGEVIGVRQEHPKSGARLDVPIEKLIYCRRGHYDEGPAGLGLLRQLVKDADTLRRLQVIEAIGLDNDLRGVPIVRIPYGLLRAAVDAGEMTQEAMDKMVKPLQNFAKNHATNASNGLALPSEVQTVGTIDERPTTVRQWDAELLQGDGSGLEEVGAAISRYAHSIARVLGCEHLLIGEGSTGSHSLHADKTREFHDAIDGLLADIKAIVKRQLLPVLAFYNDWPLEHLPDIEIESSRQTPLLDVVEVLRLFGEMGLRLTDIPEASMEVFGRLGLTAPDIEQMMAATMELDGEDGSSREADLDELAARSMEEGSLTEDALRNAGR